MMIHSPREYRRDSTNRLAETLNPGPEGARALVKTFYHAFNRRDMETFSKVWADHELIQLNNPLGRIIRGYRMIAELYQKVFKGPARVWVELEDIVEFQTPEMVIFAGREIGEFRRDEITLPLSIRTTRIVQWCGPETGWRQVRHHGSIDDAQLLGAYQVSIR